VGPHCSRVTEHAVQKHFLRKFVQFSTYNFIVELGTVQHPNLARYSTQTGHGTAPNWARYSTQTGQGTALKLGTVQHSNWARYSTQTGHGTALKLGTVQHSNWERYSTQTGHGTALKLFFIATINILNIYPAVKTSNFVQPCLNPITRNSYFCAFP
jgi:hypothetical protein